MVFNIPILKNKPKRRIRNQQITTEARSSLAWLWSLNTVGPTLFTLTYFESMCKIKKNIIKIFDFHTLSGWRHILHPPSKISVIFGQPPHLLDDDVIYGWSLITWRTISWINYKGTLETKFPVDSSPSCSDVT